MQAFRLEKLKLDRVARLQSHALLLEVFGGPAIEHDFLLGERGDRLAVESQERTERRPGAEIERRDRGIRNLPLSVAGENIVRQIGERRLTADLAEGPLRGALDGLLQQHSIGREIEIAGRRFFDRQAIVGQLRGQGPLEQVVVGLRRIVAFRLDAGENRIDAVGLIEGRLQRGRGDKGIEGNLLRRPQPEAAQSGRRNDPLDGQGGQRANGVGLAPQGAFGRNVAGHRQPHDHFVADLGPQRGGQRLVEHDLIGADLQVRSAGRSAGSPRRKGLPKALAAADHIHLPGRSPRRAAAVSQRGLQQDDRPGHDPRLGPLWIAIRGDFVGQGSPKESRHDQRRVDPPEPIERELPQAAAHRIPHHQRAGQHGGGRQNPQRHGDMNPAMLHETAENEVERRHGSRGRGSGVGGQGSGVGGQGSGVGGRGSGAGGRGSGVGSRPVGSGDGRLSRAVRLSRRTALPSRPISRRTALPSRLIVVGRLSRAV